MLIVRWQAPVLPEAAQLKMIFEAEGLEPREELLQPEVKISDHRHPFDEVRVIVSGELMFNVAGNQVLLRPGDRIEIPANTRHSYSCHGQQESLSLCAQRPF